MGEFRQNIWAPWRMAYIRSLGEETDDGCFLCRYAGAPADDGDNHVVWRGAAAFAVLNRFPYTNGHLLVSPLAHKAMLADLTPDESLELMTAVGRSLEALRECLGAQGFNVGMNVGRCAGAGLPDHLHWHVVPRWNGDTNFMSIVDDVRVIPESLEANAGMLRSWFAARRGTSGTSGQS
ncbi:MAG: HIT domain-containing protein [Phycisphaerae bacterium]|nr:HIT domain-containing protein [Phycisphaerae bacterium]NUQ48175.1 HIT domain-containing protein [Phycisphaerae bacterium]